MSERPEWLEAERRRLAATHGEAIVNEIEQSVPANPHGCKDSMDGRHWCRVHESPWPAFSGQACEAARKLGEALG